MTVSPLLIAHPLHYAAFNGCTKTLNDNLNEDADINSIDEHGRTPLHLAAISNEAAIGAFIVECGANVTIQDNEGNTPLHLAAKHGSRLVASMLLWAEAEPLTTNNHNQTPLHLAVLAKSQDVAWLLTENRGGDKAVIERDSEGRTPLDIAQELGLHDIAEMLSKCSK